MRNEENNNKDKQDDLVSKAEPRIEKYSGKEDSNKETRKK